MLICIEVFKENNRVTSDFLSRSINVNSVIIRRILCQLKSKDIVDVKRGYSGTVLAKPPEEISLLDVYKAVECIEEDKLFNFHSNPNPNCPVGKNIHLILDNKLLTVQKAMEKELESIRLSDVINEHINIIKE